MSKELKNVIINLNSILIEYLPIEKPTLLSVPSNCERDWRRAVIAVRAFPTIEIIISPSLFSG